MPRSPALTRTRSLPLGRPVDVLSRWPADRPLMLLHSGAAHPRWGRWSIAAEPAGYLRFDGRWSWQAAPLGEATGWLPPGGLPAANDDLFAGLQRIGGRVLHRKRQGVPFAGGWIGYFSYDLGRVIEPAAQVSSLQADDRNWPLIEMAWCPAALVYDHQAHRWQAAGDSAHGAAASAASVLGSPRRGRRGSLGGELRSSMTRDAHMGAVARVIEYIAAGDVFQVNITQRFAAPFAGSARLLAAGAITTAGAYYSAHLEMPAGRRLISMSPELFLDVAASGNQESSNERTVRTRPIKGTRPASADPEDLRRSEKDAAELHMIVDLMRNDLGRVCKIGSVRVVEPRAIETYPTVHHGVAEVAGVLRDDATLADLLAAAFPGGSVTGAPKIRAMQIIDELEPVRRGPYCGAIGFISDCGNAALNIAIRTIALSGGSDAGDWDDLPEAQLDYGCGGGIVADSDPAAEYAESIDKAAVLHAALQWNHG